MAIKIAINGYGRIGKNILRACYESNRNKEIQIVAINDLGDIQTNAHLTKFDSIHGKFPGDVNVEGDFFPCSFMEGMVGWKQGISILECRDFLNDVWFNPRTFIWRNQLINNDRRCPVFDL